MQSITRCPHQKAHTLTSGIVDVSVCAQCGRLLDCTPTPSAVKILCQAPFADDILSAELLSIRLAHTQPERN